MNNNAGVFLGNAMTEDYPIEDFDETIRMNNSVSFSDDAFRSAAFTQGTRQHYLGRFGRKPRVQCGF
jgi:hypothetical protein